MSASPIALAENIAKEVALFGGTTVAAAVVIKKRGKKS